MPGLLLSNELHDFISEVVCMADEVEVFTQTGQLAVRSRGKATRNNEQSIRIQFPPSSNSLTAFGRGGLCNAAGIDNEQLRAGVDSNKLQALLFKQLPDLLGLVLVDLTAKRFDGKSIHNI